MAINYAQLIGGPTSGLLDGMRNRIINGDMRIDQRNSGAAVVNTGLNVTYPLDRWVSGNAGASMTTTCQQSTVVPAGQGFTNSLFVTTGTAVTPIAAGDWATIYQRIEGYNIASFGFGASGAKSITLSFWVRCSVSGTFGVVLRGGTTTRSYASSYSISAGEVNTWVYRTITFPGDTFANTWNTANGTGLDVFWDLGVGSNLSTTTGSWQTGNFIGLTGGTKLINTTGATWYITGVQLEVGSVATEFERRDAGTEFALCLRYFWQSYALEWAPVAPYSSNYCAYIDFPVPMRSHPTITDLGSLLTFSNVGTNVSTIGNTAARPGNLGTRIFLTPGSWVGTPPSPTTGIGTLSCTIFAAFNSEL